MLSLHLFINHCTGIESTFIVVCCFLIVLMHFYLKHHLSINLCQDYAFEKQKKLPKHEGK